MVTINFLHPHMIATMLFLITIILGAIYGDSSKKTAWMIFLPVFGFILYMLYWLVVLIIYFLNNL